MLLALDTSSTWCGYTCGDGFSIPVCDAWQMEPVTFSDGADYGYLLSQTKTHMDALFVRFPGIRGVAYETPMLRTTWRKKGGDSDDQRPPDSLAKLRLLYPIPAFVEWLCRDVYRVPCREYGVKDVRKDVCGNGNATKDDVEAIAIRCGVQPPSAKTKGRQDATDSWALWKRFLRDFDRRASERWDAAIYAKRRFT